MAGRGGDRSDFDVVDSGHVHSPTFAFLNFCDIMKHRAGKKMASWLFFSPRRGQGGDSTHGT
jgi:hypothetical protein